MHSGETSSFQNIDIVQIAAAWERQAAPGGFEARCRLVLPGESLTGARILDVRCRNGKGCFKLSDVVGAKGLVVGVDWEVAHLEKARDGIANALERSGLSESNLAFELAYPEALQAVVEKYGRFNYVFLNSVVNLSPCPELALRQCHDALVPGGKLILDTLAAPNVSRDVARAEGLKLGNVVQAAPSRQTLEGWLEAAGFASWAIDEGELVHPSAGWDANHPMPFCPDDPALEEIRSVLVIAVA